MNGKENPKAFWNHVKGKLKSKSGIAPLLRDPKDKTSVKFSDKEKANILQDQFSSVFTQESQGNLPQFEKRAKADLSDLHVTKNMVEKS